MTVLRFSMHRAERLAALGRRAGHRARRDFFEDVLANADRRLRSCIARLAEGGGQARPAKKLPRS